MKKNKLTLQNKKDILLYEQGALALANVGDTWHSTSNFPELKPDPLSYYLSDVLKIDFDEFYSLAEAKEVSKKMDMDNLFPELCDYSGWFIGDILRGCVWSKIENKRITKKLITEIDEMILKVYHTYLEHLLDRDAIFEKLKYCKPQTIAKIQRILEKDL